MRGEIFSLPLEYVGIGYMCLVLLLSLMKKDILLLLLLSAGVGTEVYLVGFQIWYYTFCPYCLAFGGVIMAQFFINFNREKKRFALFWMVFAFFLFLVFFKATITPVYAQEVSLSTFGQGKIVVRLYTDYFCPPCKKLEPSLEPIIAELIRDNIITLTFIDTPFHKLSSLYVRYFLYALNEKKSFENALMVRNALIEASNQEIDDPKKLEGFLNKRGIKIRPFDVKPVFDLFTSYLKADKIDSTPSCVIVENGRKQTFVGGSEILKALANLKKKKTNQ